MICLVGGRRKAGWLLLAVLLFPLAGGAQTEPPSIISQPVSLTSRAGTSPKFTVEAAGAAPLAYRWFKDGDPLLGTGYSGVTTESLTLNYARKTNEGSYYVVVTNPFGTVISSNAALTVQDPAVGIQPTHLALPPGGTLGASAAGTAPFAYQWQYQGMAIPGATAPSLSTYPAAPVNATNAGLYQCIVSNRYGSATSAPAMLTVSAAVLDPLTSGEPNGIVYATAVQGDGRIVLGGAFTGVGANTRNRLARLLPNGKLDTQFNPNANGDVFCILEQSDGKLIVGGAFTTIAGKTCRYLGRLFPDGRLDTNFNASVSAMICCLAWQRDGQILAGGLGRLLRFNEAGVIDPTFNPTVTGTIYSIVDQPEMVTAGTGIIVGGNFLSIAGRGRQNLARVWHDGQLDTLFNTPVAGTVFALAVQRGGGVVIGGQFTSVGSQPRANVARIDLSGRVVEDFNPGASNRVLTIATQADGKHVLGGWFNSLGGVPRTGLGRLYPDGTIDPTFDPRASSTYAVTLEADGRMVIGGDFTTLMGVTCRRLGRLKGTGTVFQQLVSTPEAAQWQRGGALPEVDQVVFEQYVPGDGWMKLGDGRRTVFGWETPASPTPGLTWRARGKAAGGYCGGSGSIIEEVTGPVVILTQPTGATVAASTTIPMSVSACGAGPLVYQWFRNGVALPVETNATYDAPGVTASYQVVICNESGSAQSDVVQNWRVGGVETAARPSLNSPVYALAIQPDGKVLIGGAFTNVNEVGTGNMRRNGLLRINADGAVDTAFDPDVQGSVAALAVMPDQKIVVGGNFTSVAGEARSCLARLNADGTLDRSFVAHISGSYPAIDALALQADGKLLVGGSFAYVGGQPRKHVARLEKTGAVDPGFVPPANLHPSGIVGTIVPQSDGMILLGGHFMRAPGMYQDYLWVTQTGAYAATGYTTPTMPSGYGVTAAVQQPDSKVILGGFGFQVDAQPSRTLARLNADRSPDNAFAAYADGPVLCLAAHADGRVLVGGAFTKLNGATRNCLGRLYPDGTLDPDFNPGLSGTNGAALYAVAPQPDGKIILGGLFTNVNLVTSTRYNFARLPVWGAVTETWSYDGSSLNWLRDGLAPEFQSVMLEMSGDGSSWEPVMEAGRVPGGWQITGVSLAARQQLRARGQGSISGAHTWQAETLLGPPIIKTQPVSITNALGSIAGFFVGLQGPGPFGYQWYHDGVPLQDGGHIAGARGPLLTLLTRPADAGDYYVTATNLFGSVTSRNVTLTTLDLLTPPLILTDETAFGIHTNHFSFRIAAVRGQTCVVEYSPNLTTWYPLTTNVATTANPLIFVDRDTATWARYYRVGLK